jgi:endonuclease-8
VPEGHTLHRLATALAEAFAGHQVRASSPQGRFAESAALLDGRVLGSTEAYGKHLFMTFDDVDVVHVHLGLYGRFDVHRAVPEVPEPVGQVRLRLVGGGSYADLRGAPACELFTPAERAAMLARLGPDPLRADADPDVAWARIRRSRAPIAGLLMDQTVVAGIGNVYRAELLHEVTDRHRLNAIADDWFHRFTVTRLGLALCPQHARLRRPVDIRIKDRDGGALVAVRERQIGRGGRFPHPAFAGSNSDDIANFA